MLRPNVANSDIRSMLASLCLRLSKKATDLPYRIDNIHKLDFEVEEAAHYKSANCRVTDLLEQRAGQTKLGSRQICNLGTYYRGDIEALETQITAMQELYNRIVSAGTAAC